MAKGKKSSDLPAAPQYQEDPWYQKGIEKLFGLGQRLTEFDFTGKLSGLAETISTSPQMTKLFLQGLKSQLDPIFRDIRTQTISQLAASNQLESSVTANRLAQLEEDIEGRYITQTTQFGIADIDRALRNRISLFGTGLDVTGQATTFAGAGEARKNQFNLANYANIVAGKMYGEDDKGGWGGALMGGLGGAATGAAVGSIVPGIGTGVGAGVGALMGGIGGYFAPRGAGRQILTAGGGTLAIAGMPRSTAGAGLRMREGEGLGLYDEGYQAYKRSRGLV